MATIIDLDKRDIAIEKIKNNIKMLDNQLEDTYTRLERETNNKEEYNKEIKKEYENLFKEEEELKKQQIKKLKELYNYINRQTKNSKAEDKIDILNEINRIENLMRK